VPRGAILPGEAFGFGMALAIGSVLVLGLAVNLVAAGLLAFTIFFYVVVYTIWLKRSTPQNIVIGGAAGAFPPMIGWAAVTGDVSLASIALFLIIFMWTPPHFWALSLYREGDYAKAGVPMMPVVAGQRSTKLQMLVYTLILCPLTLAPVFLGVSGWVYGAASIALNLGFVGHAVRVLKSDDLRYAKRMFGFSLLYLFLHFALLCVDRAPGILSVLS
jgi:protoheme IX farnesyltransferase